MAPVVALRARIFSALGIAAILPLTSSAETGAPVYAETACLTDNGDGVCPDPETAAGVLNVAQECSLVSVDAEGTYADGRCCYPVTVSCDARDHGPEDDFDCGCYGRPLVLEGRATQAPAVRTDAWARGRTADLAGLSATERERLAAFWTENGLAEHSSVAGFARFTLDLVALGAPAGLVSRAQFASIEEIHHARLCFALASGYRGAPVGPGPLPMPEGAPVARTLVELAVTTAREGAVGETLSALLAAEMLSRATDPAVRAVLAIIVRDEARHAELAWATLRWAVEVGGDEVRVAVREELARAAMRASDPGPVDPRLAAHGMVDVATARRIAAEGVRDLIRPASEGLEQVARAA